MDLLMGTPWNFKGEPAQVHGSFGIAQLIEGMDGKALFQKADNALYQA